MKTLIRVGMILLSTLILAGCNSGNKTNPQGSDTATISNKSIDTVAMKKPQAPIIEEKVSNAKKVEEVK